VKTEREREEREEREEKRREEKRERREEKGFTVWMPKLRDETKFRRRHWIRFRKCHE
jgi:hypothetical protein